MKLKHSKNLPYILVVFNTLFIILGSLYMFPASGKTIVYLLFLCVVTVNVVIGGFRSGMLSIALVFFSSAIYFFSRMNLPLEGQLFTIIELLVFALTGTLGSYVIEKYKKTDLAKEYEEKERQYTQLLKKIKTENTKLHQEIKVRDEFLSIASHELKTPLTSMLLKLQLILHNIRNVSLANFSVENLLKMLETAEQQTQRLSRMINDLLNVSLITTGKLRLELEKTNLTELVKGVASEFSEKMEKDGYTLKLNANTPIEIYADKLRIEQAVTNLLSNAIKYGKGNPIEVSVFKNGSTARIQVKDQGIGIDPAMHEKIFALFERGVTNNNYKGLGVGLYITGQIVKAHNGSIKLTSKPNTGSVFTIELPIQPQEKK